ncbi:NAD-binding protein [Trujillonella endophytica]|uniref:NAD-binding protein n=1 Tax=Trujillonella endophytica TaxID=673521 RepID=UPI00244E9799|nr:NAD-binding protein [Trujillella endophytica]
MEHVGPLGSGQRVKLLNNLLFGAHVQLAVEAARVAESFGLDVAQVARTLHTCSGQSYALDLVAASGSAAALVQGAGPYIRKDVLVARQVAADLGVSLGTMDAATRPLTEL